MVLFTYLSKLVAKITLPEEICEFSIFDCSSRPRVHQQTWPVKMFSQKGTVVCFYNNQHLTGFQINGEGLQ